MLQVRSYDTITYSLQNPCLPSQTSRHQRLLQKRGFSFLKTRSRFLMINSPEKRPRFAQVIPQANQEELEAPLISPTEREIDYTRAILLFLIPAVSPTVKTRTLRYIADRRDALRL